MICERYRCDVSCGSCGDRVPAGAPVYLVTKANLRRCAECAQKIGALPSAPDPLPLIQRAAPEVVSLKRFARQDVAATVRQNILDFRSRQAGNQ